MPAPTLTLVHDAGVDAALDAALGAGRVLDRVAVKAVALRGRSLLLLRASSGALKLPGGGVEPGESDEQALRRELDEECATPLLSLGEEVATTVQLALPRETSYDVFRMTSRHYRVDVGEPTGGTRLEDYEARLGLEPAWVDVDDAVVMCERLLARHDVAHRWLARELHVLRLVEESLR